MAGLNQIVYSSPDEAEEGTEVEWSKFGYVPVSDEDTEAIGAELISSILGKSETETQRPLLVDRSNPMSLVNLQQKDMPYAQIQPQKRPQNNRQNPWQQRREFAGYSANQSQPRIPAGQGNLVRQILQRRNQMHQHAAPRMGQQMPQSTPFMGYAANQQRMPRPPMPAPQMQRPFPPSGPQPRPAMGPQQPNIYQPLGQPAPAAQRPYYAMDPYQGHGGF